VLAGNVGVEQAAKAAGIRCRGAVRAGSGRRHRRDRPMPKVFDVLEPVADGYRNWLKKDYVVSAEELMLDRTQLMGLTAHEMTVLVGGMRVLGANHGGSKAWRVHRPRRCADQRLLRQPDRHGLHLATGLAGFTKSATARPARSGGRPPRGPDLRVELDPAGLRRSLCPGRRREKFVHDFVAAWTKVMNADRFDLTMLHDELRDPGQSLGRQGRSPCDAG
jgi:catalase-peroxidase